MSEHPSPSPMRCATTVDRRRPWIRVAVGLASFAGMMTVAIYGGVEVGSLEHLERINGAGVWLTTSLIEASATILALLLATVGVSERIERGVEGPHFISLIRLTARGGFFTIGPAVLFKLVEVASASLVREGSLVSVLGVTQLLLLAAAVGAFAFLLASLYATLKVTFLGMPESVPEEEAEEEAEEAHRHVKGLRAATVLD